jgi:hypothetical protein
MGMSSFNNAYLNFENKLNLFGNCTFIVINAIVVIHMEDMVLLAKLIVTCLVMEIVSRSVVEIGEIQFIEYSHFFVL